MLKLFRTNLVNRLFKLGALALLLGMALQGATLEYLSLDDMARRSTAIVRARIAGSYAAAGRSIIYTHYRIQVLEQWKGNAASELEVVLPGGAVNGRRQTCPGTPELIPGQEYLLFLWTSPASGLTHAIGLSQGVFSVRRSPEGEAVAQRGPSSGLMLNSAGLPVRDTAVSLRLSDFRGRVRTALADGRASR